MKTFMKLDLHVHLLSMLARLTNAKVLISKMCPRTEKACKKLLGRKNEAAGYWTCSLVSAHTHSLSRMCTYTQSHLGRYYVILCSLNVNLF